jgi:hypothetical protein
MCAFYLPAINPALHDGFQCLLFRHTVVWKLPHSNLILVVVNTLCSGNEQSEVKEKMEVSGSDRLCLKANNELARKKPKTCVGRGNKTQMVRQPY